MYYPDDGKELCLRHLKGRTWEGEEREAEKVELYKQLKRKAEGETSLDLSECASEERSSEGDS